MSSKKLSSILSQVPSATVSDEKRKSYIQTTKDTETEEEVVKIVARIPISLKEEIRAYIKKNKEETESTLLIKGLKALGFNIDAKWTIDRRKLR